MITLTKAQLNQILSALDGQPRNPNTKDTALKSDSRPEDYSEASAWAKTPALGSGLPIARGTVVTSPMA